MPDTTKDAKETKKVLGRYLDGIGVATGRINEIEARQEEIRERFEAILEEAPGEVTPEAKDLMVERRELSDEHSEMLRIRAALERKAADARVTLGRLAVEATVSKARKTAGGLVGEWSNHLQRAEEYERKARESREKAEGGAARSYRLSWAVRAVGRILAIETGEVRTVSGVRPPRASIRNHLDQGKLRRACEETLAILDAEDVLTDEAKEAIESAIERLDDEEEARRRGEKAKAARAKDEAKREEAREAVDEWLREILRDGPVPRDRIYRAARANDVAISHKSPGGSHGADLTSAVRERKSVPVHVLERVDDPRPRPVWWALAGTAYDDEGFRRVGSGGVLEGAR